MRRSALPALALVATSLLTGCGDDGSDGQEPKDDSTSSATSGETSPAPGDPTGSSSDDASESASDTTTEAALDEKVAETAGKLDCTASEGTAGFEGETEHECGPFLIVDWTTAGISEEEMFTAIDNWVDEDRPLWLYAGDMVLVYGTVEDLDGVSSAFE
ncbi:MAG: hypothetical protein NTX33_04695 [Propionibacteriales bacterium]|nr:hypothetical protein [Propionibacteriales bacterium]